MRERTRTVGCRLTYGDVAEQRVEPRNAEYGSIEVSSVEDGALLANRRSKSVRPLEFVRSR